MSNIFTKAANVVGDAIGGFTDAITGGGRTMSNSSAGAMGNKMRLDGTIAGEDKKAGEGMKKGGKVSSASSRADGIAVKGKTRGRMV
jgi:hypothetical protein